MTNFASYEKVIEATVNTIKHHVRILLHSDKASLDETLKNVPPSATVSEIVEDEDGYGEIIFAEERS